MTHKVVLKDAFKRYTLDQDKILPPEETVKKIKERFQHVNLDILERTARIDNGRLGIPVYLSYCGKDARAVTGTRKQMGKGATPAQAEASAVMELAERFSFFSFCNTPDNFFTDTYKNLKARALPFEMIAQSVHDHSREREITRNIFDNLPLKWTWGYNLTRQAEVLVPFNWFFTINEYNGPSAGNCSEEALSQGICEIVERHVSSIISHKQLRVPAISPDSATEPLVREMLQKYQRTGIQLFVSDFSLDTGIPTVGILAYDPATFPQTSEIVWTAGTTPDPQKALSRALTEVAQLAGDFNTGANYEASGLPKFSSLDQAGFITEPENHVSITSLPNLSNNNIRIEVENCIAALSRKGLDVIVINTRHPRLDIPAFYTIIPGAHFRERALGTSVGMFAAKLITETQPPEQAISELMRMGRMLPDKYYLQFYLGTAHLSMNDPKTACTHLNRALDLNPILQDIPSIYSYLGIALKEMQDYRQAISVLEKGESYDSERTDIHNLLGFCHFKLKDHEKAIACFQKAIALNPGSAIDYANIASNYRDLGKTEEAIHYYELALSLDPSIDFARDNLEKLRSSSIL
ncbi:MAG: YcaO-like family protein [Deltaproteobacteria bacterium]|nr:YcaO-like family protein [Deltaproteobacteria bacterium]